MTKGAILAERDMVPRLGWLPFLLLSDFVVQYCFVLWRCRGSWVARRWCRRLPQDFAPPLLGVAFGRIDGEADRMACRS